MSNLIIRPSRIRDCEAIGRVLRRSYSRLLTEDYPEPLLSKALPVLSRPRPELLSLPGYLVATVEGGVVATGGWSRANPAGGGAAETVGHIRHLACDPDFLRQGISRALMDQVVAQARAAGVRLLCCLSTRTAAPFYRAQGFEGRTEIDVRLQPGLLFPAVEMRRVLT